MAGSTEREGNQASSTTATAAATESLVIGESAPLGHRWRRSHTIGSITIESTTSVANEVPCTNPTNSSVVANGAPGTNPTNPSAVANGVPTTNPTSPSAVVNGVPCTNPTNPSAVANGVSCTNPTSFSVVANGVSGANPTNPSRGLELEPSPELPPLRFPTIHAGGGSCEGDGDGYASAHTRSHSELPDSCTGQSRAHSEGHQASPSELPDRRTGQSRAHSEGQQASPSELQTVTAAISGIGVMGDIEDEYLLGGSDVREEQKYFQKEQKSVGDIYSNIIGRRAGPCPSDEGIAAGDGGARSRRDRSGSVDSGTASRPAGPHSLTGANVYETIETRRIRLQRIGGKPAAESLQVEQRGQRLHAPGNASGKVVLEGAKTEDAHGRDSVSAGGVAAAGVHSAAGRSADSTWGNRSDAQTVVGTAGPSRNFLNTTSAPIQTRVRSEGSRSQSRSGSGSPTFNVFGFYDEDSD